MELGELYPLAERRLVYPPENPNNRIHLFTNKRFLKAIGAKSLGLSLNGYNLLTFSPLDILDPESLGNNVGAYPLVKVYSVGVNLNF